ADDGIRLFHVTGVKTCALPIYILIIEDNSNDGICCNYGTGSYTLTSVEGNLLASGGQFGAVDSTEFCISTVVDVPRASHDFINRSLERRVGQELRYRTSPTLYW